MAYGNPIPTSVSVDVSNSPQFRQAEDERRKAESAARLHQQEARLSILRQAIKDEQKNNRNGLVSDRYAALTDLEARLTGVPALRAPSVGEDARRRAKIQAEYLKTHQIRDARAVADQQWRNSADGMIYSRLSLPTVEATAMAMLPVGRVGQVAPIGSMTAKQAAKALATDFASWGAFSGSVSKLQGASWSEAGKEALVDGLQGAFLRALPGANVHPRMRPFVEGVRFGTMDAARSVAGDVINGRPVDLTAAVDAARAGFGTGAGFAVAGGVWNNMPRSGKNFIKGAGVALGTQLLSDESYKQMPHPTHPSVAASWLEANQGSTLADYFDTLSDDEVLPVVREIPESAYAVPDTEDAFNKMTDDDWNRIRYLQELRARSHRVGVHQAAKAGTMDRDLKQMASFLATDEVPDTIFGVPVVSKPEQYTNADIQFFKEHPEAGGYYDMGEGTPDDGSLEGSATQLDVPVDDSVAFTIPMEGTDKKVFEYEDSKGKKHYRIGHGFVDEYWADDNNGGRTKVTVTKDTKALSEAELDFAAKEKMKDVHSTLKRRFKGSWEYLSDAQKVVLADIAYHGGEHFAADKFIADLGAAVAYRTNRNDPVAKTAFHQGRGYRDRGTTVDPVDQVFVNHIPTYFLDNGTTPIRSRVNARGAKLGIQGPLAKKLMFGSDAALYKQNGYTQDPKTKEWKKGTR